jgi:hypothetical protein
VNTAVVERDHSKKQFCGLCFENTRLQSKKLSGSGSESVSIAVPMPIPTAMHGAQKPQSIFTHPGAPKEHERLRGGF